MAPQPIAHTCMNTEKYAAVLFDDCSDSPVIACYAAPAAGATNYSLTDDCIPDRVSLTPIANSTMMESTCASAPPRDASSASMVGLLAENAACPQSATADHLPPRHNQDPASRAQKVGPFEYAQTVDDLWPNVSQKLSANAHLAIYDVVRVHASQITWGHGSLSHQV